MAKQFIAYPDNPYTLPPSTIRGAKMPKLNKLLNIDWLEFTAIRKKDLLSEDLFLYSIKQNDAARSRYFARVFDVWHIDDPDNKFCTFTSDAHVSFIDKNILVCKIENRYLYHKNLRHYIDRLLDEFGLEFKHFGRLDLSLDFQKFDTDVQINDFLQSVAKCEFIKCGQRNMKPSTEISESYFTEDGQLFYSGRNVKGVSWGSRSSELYIVMYNKSLEMRQKKRKPYIVETWERHGFDTSIDTYRLEFSIKPKKGMIYLETGELINHKTIDFIALDHINALFNTLFSKKFCFAKVDGKTRFSRLEKVELFHLDNYNAVLADTSDKQDSSNHTKAFIGMVYKRIKNFSYKDTQDLWHLEYYLSELLYRYHLSAWFKRKWPDYVVKDYEVQLGQLSLFEDFNFN